MRYFVGFLITLGLLILLLIMLFSGGGDDKAKVPQTKRTLPDLAATTAEMRLTTDGPVNADQLHQKSRISVDRNNVTFEQIKGYGGDVTSMQKFANTREAFSTFLLALNHAGFTKGNPDKALRDERGYCALGSRYIFEVVENGKTLQRFWSTSCGKPKTYLGNVGLTINLFRAQVPDYNQLSKQNQANQPSRSSSGGNIFGL